MNDYSETNDQMICIGTSWIRASRIESIWTEHSNTIGLYTVSVKMFSGHTFVTHGMPKGEAEKIARLAVGQ